MKKHFLIVVLFCLIFSFYTVSALYEGTINVGVGDDVEVTIGDSPSFNVSEGECTSGETTCSGTNYYLCIDDVWVNQGQVDGQCGYTTPATTPTSTGGGGGGGSRIASFIQDLFSGDETSSTPETEEIELNETSGETTDSRSFLTGAVTGITNFAQSPTGIATGAILIIGLIGGIMFFNFKKGKLGKENSEDNSEEESQDFSDEEDKEE